MREGVFVCERVCVFVWLYMGVYVSAPLNLRPKTVHTSHYTIPYTIVVCLLVVFKHVCSLYLGHLLPLIRPPVIEENLPSFGVLERNSPDRIGWRGSEDKFAKPTFFLPCMTRKDN